MLWASTFCAFCNLSTMPNSVIVPLIKVPSSESRDPASPKSPHEEVHSFTLMWHQDTNSFIIGPEPYQRRGVPTCSWGKCYSNQSSNLLQFSALMNRAYVPCTGRLRPRELIPSKVLISISGHPSARLPAQQKHYLLRPLASWRAAQTWGISRQPRWDRQDAGRQKCHFEGTKAGPERQSKTKRRRY